MTMHPPYLASVEVTNHAGDFKNSFNLYTSYAELRSTSRQSNYSNRGRWQHITIIRQFIVIYSVNAVYLHIIRKKRKTNSEQ